MVNNATKGHYRHRNYTVDSARIRSIVGAAFFLIPMAGCSKLGFDEATTLSSRSLRTYAYPASVEKPVVKKTVKAKATSTPTVKLASGQYLGSAPYICTPSGFGRTSTCFTRSTGR
jgi:hypothetical protein